MPLHTMILTFHYSPRMTHMNSDSTSGVIDEFTIFRLYTSLRTAKSSMLGDVYLNTVDALGLCQDTW